MEEAGFGPSEKPPDETDDFSSLTVNNEVCDERNADLQAVFASACDDMKKSEL